MLAAVSNPAVGPIQDLKAVGSGSQDPKMLAAVSNLAAGPVEDLEFVGFERRDPRMPRC